MNNKYLNYPKKLTEKEQPNHSHVFTLTHAGKHSLMENAFKKYFEAESHQDKLLYMYSFFDHAYHLKDWIKKVNHKEDFSTMWKRYSENIYFKMTRDLVTKSKHFKITQSAHYDERIGLGETTLFKDGKRMRRLDVVIQDEFIPVDDLIMATRNFWRELFNNEGYL